MKIPNKLSWKVRDDLVVVVGLMFIPVVNYLFFSLTIQCFIFPRHAYVPFLPVFLLFSYRGLSVPPLCRNF